MSWFLLGLMFGVVFGNWYAHQQIAAECERLGGFFVGKKIYLVDEIIDNSSKDAYKLPPGNYESYTINPPPAKPRPSVSVYAPPIRSPQQPKETK